MALRTSPAPPLVAKKPAPFLARPGTVPGLAALLAVNLAAVTFFLLAFSRHGVAFGPYRIDLNVYQNGARAWLSGGNLYGHLPLTTAGVRLPFNYPPLAAVLLSPLAFLPMAAASAVLSLVTIVLLAAVLRLLVRCLTGVPSGSWWAVAWLLPPALFLEPVRNTLSYGQINVVLMAMVSLDCLTGRPRWPRGALVGIAAAVKLTPAAFVLFFLLRRDYRAAGTAAVSFAAAAGAGFVLAWSDSVRYWTGVIFQIGRLGNSAYAANQSIQAVMIRAGADPRTLAGTAAWLALSALTVAVAGRGMRHAFAAGEDAWALALNAFAALLISPISWSHHWVWCVPAILTLAVIGWRHRARLPLATATAGLAVFAAAPQWWFPSGDDVELRWAAWQQVVGSTYLIFAALVLLLSAAARLTPATRSPASLRPADPAGRGRPRSGRQGRREAEPGQGVRVEAGHRADLRTRQGQHDQPDRVEGAGLRVAGVAAEGGLAVGARREQPDGPPGP
jgi:alpha-1,2-mannosyltransferase